MAIEGEMTDVKQTATFSEKTMVEYADTWTMDRVVRWLETNNFKGAIEFFKANQLCGKAFLDIDMSFLMGAHSDLPLPYTENRKLAHGIKGLRPGNNNVRYNNSNNTGRYGNTDSKTPLIPERKSSNNEQVLDWMKNYNIPHRPIPSTGIPTNRSNNNIRTSGSTINNLSNSSSTTSRFPLSPSSPRILENDGNWKIGRRRDHLVQLAPQQQSIHVTKDSDTFHSLQVTGMHDARSIKNSILRKLGLEDTALTDNELSHICQSSDHSSTNRILVKPADHALDYYKLYSKDGTNCYDFATQGGYQSDHDINRRYENKYTTASPSEGLEDSREDSGYFERTSRKQSIDADTSPWSLHPVPTVDANNRPHVWAVTPPSQRSSTSSTDTQNSDVGLSDPNTALWPVHQEVPAQEPSLWSVPPKNYHEEPLTTSQSLWAIPPSSTTTSNQHSITSPNASVNQYPNNTATSNTLTSSVSLWAVAPTNLSAPTPSPSLWAIVPQIKKAESSPTVPTTTSPVRQFGSENLNLHPSISAKTHSPPKKRGVQFSEQQQTEESDASLEEGIESVSLSDPPSELSIDTAPTLHHRNSTPITSPSGLNDHEEENWAERPSVEKLYKDIDKYLPGHDLDKEIIVEPTSTNQTTQATLVTALPPGRKLQGHKKSIRNVANEAHRNWRNAVNVIRANNLLRRRSTKMWHRTVEQVKPGMKANLQTDDLKPSKKSKILQWIRGELIGKGSFGRVYHALNVEAGEWIAVKQVDLPVTKADYANPQLLETKDSLFREISLLEDLDNEYIVQYLGYDVDLDEGHINIFLEYVPGGSIASCLAKTGKFDEPLVRFFTRQILMGLAYLHNRNVLHRDIKAGNILLDQNGVCKITDFGLSKLSGQDKAYDPHSNNSVMRGTVFWMAPEVVKGTNYNAKVDIWSLGCTVIEMLTGNHPWLDLNMLAALYSLGKYQAPPIPEYLPEDVKNFLNLCFTINPEDRPTAEQLLTHPFVQPDASFEFKKYMKNAEIERRASRRMNTIPVEN
ncbi:hypothetical protein INT48_008528 [Thamnidium elegans]|uniref:Protein kinase domain-containing protein n=1 Tax=Thamnidium elegans TaxID=101142 RepID=A0A8H7SUU2_9FUNG|nr:hypothetical protein INT48_008528 [Thamnidium elegans]